MRLITSDGGECGDVLEFASGFLLSAITTYKRTGNYCYQIGGNAGSAYYPPFASPITEFYSFKGLRFSQVSTAYQFVWLNGASTVAGSFRVKTFGNAVASVEMYDGTTLRATSSLFSMNANEFHAYEFHVKQAASPNGIFQVKFDGTMVLDWTGATNNQPSIDRVGIVTTGASVLYLDDFCLNDPSGDHDNTWIGNCGILAPKVPIGAGTYNGFTPSAGSAYACVDDVPHNSDTDYIAASAAGQKHTFALSNLAGLPAGAGISRVIGHVVAKQSGTGDTISTLFRSAATNTQSAAVPLTAVYQKYKSDELRTNPATSQAWGVSAIDALEFGPAS